MEKTTLYKRGKAKDQILTWSIWVGEENGVPTVYRESGTLKGKKTIKKKFFKKGNNIGKSNEKTAMDLAKEDCARYIKGNIEDNMVLAVEDINLPPKFIKPALAKSFDPKKIKFPCYVQPKLNGARAFSLRHLGDNRIISRERHDFAGDVHIECSLGVVFDNTSPDGEIYKHGWSFQQVISMLKKWYNRGENPDYPDLASEDLEYWVYDLAIPDKTYQERKDAIDGLIPLEHPIIKPVQTELCNNLKEAKKWHDYFVAQGFEGLIIRDPNSFYAFNDRNWSLIKYKEFQDAEFIVIGHEIEPWDDTLTGTQRELILWVCESDSGNKFTVRPVGSFAERERLAKSPTDHYGKMLTVRFQELSEEGTPIFGTGRGFAEGEGFRDYE